MNIHEGSSYKVSKVSFLQPWTACLFHSSNFLIFGLSFVFRLQILMSLIIFKAISRLISTKSEKLKVISKESLF